MSDCLLEPNILLLGFAEKKQATVTQLLATQACHLQVVLNLQQALDLSAETMPHLVLVDAAHSVDEAVLPQFKGIPLFVVVDNAEQAVHILQQGSSMCVLNLAWPEVAQRQLDGQFVAIRRMLALHNDATQCASQRQQAEAENKSKTHFLAEASHDLRQPIHSMQLLLEVLHSRLLDDPRNLEIVQHIRASARSLSELLDALLVISKLDAGMVEPALKPLRLKRAIAEVCQDLLPQAEEKNLRLHCYSRDFLVHTDEQLFKRMLRNLVHNAIRYTKTGRVVVGARQCQGLVEVQVWDNGIGIAQHNQKKIFEAFFQLGDMEKSGSDGMGLGLSSVQKSADLLGYRIRLVSKEGQGSMFAIRLPFITPDKNQDMEK